MNNFKQFITDCWVRMHPNKEKLFTKYYHGNLWRDEESRSGVGSTLLHTERLRAQLPEFFRRYDIRAILDAPCGDYNWFRHIPRDGITYIGADIVRPLIDQNNVKFKDEFTKFVHLDITKDELPTADVWICRDVLFHLSEKDIFRALRNFISSDIPFVLTTTFPEHLRNTDIPTGSFRLINLELSPFNFPPPIECLVDSIPNWQTRWLALWDRAAVQKAMAKQYRS